MKYNYWKIGFLIHGILPFGFIISLLAFYLHTRTFLGYFPEYNKPDPKTLDFYDSYSFLVNSTIGLWIISFVITIPLILVYFVIKRKKSDWKLIGFSLASQSIAIVLFFSDIFKWYID